LDWPGFGLTGPDPTGNYSNERSAQFLLAFMDELGVPKASLIGNSMGGQIAWMFASLHPERVGKLVLISPAGFSSPGQDYGKKPEVPAVIKILPYVLPPYFVQMSLAPAFGERGHLTPALIARYRDFMRAPGARPAMIARMEQDVLTDPAPALQRLQMPVLLLWGTKDGMIPVSNAADYLKLIPQAKCIELPGTGHVPQEEAPEASLRPLRAFLMGQDHG
jgi:pimeloyl-ACP methyl ester carboxylesterase